MRAIVVYESLTGNTAAAGDAIAAGLRDGGIATDAYPITGVDHQALSLADLVVVGSWTDGIFVVGQRPGRLSRVKALPVIAGKTSAVYLTYALNPGRALAKLQTAVEARGGEVIGGMTIRRDRLDEGAALFVERLIASLTV